MPDCTASERLTGTGRPVVLGAGAIGGYVAANLHRNGAAPILVSGWAAHRAAIGKPGLVVRWPDGSRSTHPMSSRAPTALTGVRTDLVILTVKGGGTAQYAALAEQLLTENGVLLTLQNGVPAPYLAERLGTARVIGGNALVTAERTAPGEVALTSRSSTLVVGALTPTMRSAAHALVPLLGGQWCSVIVTDNILGVNWSKLLNNHRLNGLCVLSGRTIGETIDDPRWRRLSLALLREAAAVADAAGVRLAPLPTVDMPALVGLLDTEPAAAEKLLLSHARLVRDAKPSTLQDYERGRPSELPHLTGFLLEQAERFGVPVPVSRALAVQVSRLECGSERSPQVLTAMTDALGSQG